MNKPIIPGSAEWERASLLFHLVKYAQSSNGIEMIIKFARGELSLLKTKNGKATKDRCDFCGVAVAARVSKVRTCMGSSCRKAYLNQQARRYVERNPQKAKARKAITNAVSNGKLKRQPCVICGKTNAQAHHTDYEKPLEVVWVCRAHHDELHANESQV